MAPFQKLNDINVWTGSKELVLHVYSLSSDARIRSDSAYVDQLRRAAISIMSNIAEGFGRHSDRDFAHFLTIARGSALETKSLLSLGLDLGYIDAERHVEIDEATSHIIAQLTSLSQYLRKSPKRKASPSST